MSGCSGYADVLNELKAAINLKLSHIYKKKSFIILYKCALQQQHFSLISSLQSAGWQSLHHMVGSLQCKVAPPQEVVECPAEASLPRLLVQVSMCMLFIYFFLAFLIPNLYLAFFQSYMHYIHQLY